MVKWVRGRCAHRVCVDATTKNVVALWYLKFVCALQISFHFIPLRVDLSKRCNWCGRRVSVCVCVGVPWGWSYCRLRGMPAWIACYKASPFPFPSYRLDYADLQLVMLSFVVFSCRCRCRLLLLMFVVVVPDLLLPCKCHTDPASGYIGWEVVFNCSIALFPF